MSEKDDRRLGLEWERALTNGFIHDGWVDSVAHSNGFRDTTISIMSPWHWNLNKHQLPLDLSYGQIDRMRLIFRFKDVADFRISHEQEEYEVCEDGTTRVESVSGLARQWVSRQDIYLHSEIDGDESAIASAREAHGGHFRSVRMGLTGGRYITCIFRDCHCVPSSWAAYDAWLDYLPSLQGVEMPPLRTTALTTAGRYVHDHRRHLCTTRITQRSSTSPHMDVLHLCDDCIGEWLEDYAPECMIPRVDSGSGELTRLHGDEQSWERGRFPGQKCQCEIERPID